MGGGGSLKYLRCDTFCLSFYGGYPWVTELKLAPRWNQLAGLLSYIMAYVYKTITYQKFQAMM